MEYFYSLTPRQFANISKGYQNKIEAKYKLSWEQTRMIRYQIYLGTPTKGKKEKITEFMPFTWEKKPKESNQMTKAEKLEMFSKWDKVKFKQQ